MRRSFLSVIIFIICPLIIYAIDDKPYVTSTKQKGSFPLFVNTTGASLCISGNDYLGVIRAFKDLQSDIDRVTKFKPQLFIDKTPNEKVLVIAGTIGKSTLIDALIRDKKIDVTTIAGKWETFLTQVVEKPMKGVDQALVIVGSDKRGTIFGIYDLSQQIGVSPWYYWVDVPVKHQSSLYVLPGIHTQGTPAVKYRGIFINDESPAFKNWATEKFGGINHQCYEKIFELLLRNKANFLWPSMWPPTMFYVTDPLNPKVADEYGIVVSTSHHEPMTRAHDEWSLFKGGAWDYKTNKEKLQEFWRGGIERIGNYETVVTIGMRGDGDAGMAKETAVDLLKTIIKDQREIIKTVTGKPADKTPQVWAIYKEVQDYYDKGMRVDDDITILFSDDNWGNIRYLPKKEDLNRRGGYGMYYHFDYVGAPISYRWLNVTQIERVWEQMKLTYDHGVKDIWIANVGDIKPMELPISFFMDYAWNPNAIQAKDLPKYYVKWAKQQFGDEYANDIAELLSHYTKYNSRRTPEMLTPTTYSIENYREADRVVEQYNELADKSMKIYNQLAEGYKPAFYQSVLFPIEMCANVNEMYIAAGKNKYYAERGAVSANYYADKVRELFNKDAEFTKAFHEFNDGKWNHMMSQTHIGYTYWNHPPMNMMPAVSYVQAKKPAELGYLLEYGQRPRWGWLDVEADWDFNHSLPQFDPINNQNYYIDIINRGQEKLSYNISAKDNWIKLSKAQGVIEFNEKVYVSIDWNNAPKGRAVGKILVSGTDKEYTVEVPILNELTPVSGFIENNGVISFEAANFARKIDTKDIHWTVVPNLGRTNSSIIIEPVTATRQTPGSTSPRVEYDFTVFNAGDLSVEIFLSPTQDFKKQDGLRFAVSIDDEQPQIINMNEGEIKPDYEYAEWWSKSVGDHIKIKRTKHTISKTGKHVLKLWMVDTGIVFQKIVVDAGGLKPSYLGPPESFYK